MYTTVFDIKFFYEFYMCVCVWTEKLLGCWDDACSAQVGGGSTTGGRHALEEVGIWKIANKTS